MNETHKENGRTCGFRPPSSTLDRYSLMKESNVKWYLKNAMENGVFKHFPESKNEFLPKNKVAAKGSSLLNGKFQPQNAGFDIKKLYPELSSKLGLTHSPRGDKMTKVAVNKKSGKRILTHLEDVDNGRSLKYKMCFTMKDKPLNQGIYKTMTYESIGSLENKGSGSKVSKCSVKTQKNMVKVKPNNILLNGTKDSKLLPPQSRKNAGYVKCKPKCEVSSKNYSSDDAGECFRHSSYSKTQSSDVIKLLPRNTSVSMPNDEMLPSVRVNRIHQNDYYAYKSDLFPLGFESSECDTSDDDAQMEFVSSHEYFLNTDSSDGNFECDAEKFSRQEVKMRKDSLKVWELRLNQRWALMKSHLEAAKVESKRCSAKSKEERHRKASDIRSSLLESTACVYMGEEDKLCRKKSLPGSRHCLQHITYNVDQQLFSQCSAKREDNIWCRIPTFDILHDPPLCMEHSSDKSLQASPSQESVEKLRRPKKKSKMCGLSRGKRYKKRRHSFESSIIPSTRVRPPINSPGSCFGSVDPPPSPLTASNIFSHCSDENDGEFDKEMEGPLEAASGLLDSKAFQEVLNKLPDSDFSQILSCTSDNRHLSDDEDKKEKGIVKMRENETTLEENDISGTKTLDTIISFNQHELNAISQVLSSMVNDHALINLESFGSVEGMVAKEDGPAVTPPSFLEVSTSSISFSEDSNSESSKGLTARDTSSPAGDCASHLISIHHPVNSLTVQPAALQPL